MRNKCFALCAIVAIVQMAASSSVAGNSTDKLSVYVVNYPLKYFAERIGGEHVKVVFPAPANVDPAYWMPEVKLIVAYQQADLILLNGAGYTKWIDKVSLPRSKMINTSKQFRDQYIRSEIAVTHSHGPQGEHAHEDVAFTTWLDFRQAALQAEAIADTLIRKKSNSRQFFEKNLATLKSNLLALDSALREIVDKNPSLPLLASHPVYDYLSRGYALNLKSVHWEPDEMPDTEQWLELQKLLQAHPAKWMLWEGTPIKESVERLRSLEIKSLVYDPCGNAPQEVDFLQVILIAYEISKLLRFDKGLWRSFEKKEPAAGRGGYSDRTVNRILAHLKTLAKWIHKLKPFPLGNPMAKTKLMPIGNDLEIERAISPTERRRILMGTRFLERGYPPYTFGQAKFCYIG